MSHAQAVDALLKAALPLASKRLYKSLLYVSDLDPPEELMRARPVARRKLVMAVTAESHRQALEASGVPALLIPGYELTRAERLKLAVVAGVSRGLFKTRDTLLAMVGARATRLPDSLQVVTIGGSSEEQLAFASFRRSEGGSPEVLEALLALAVSIGVEGWEGAPLGAIFTYGDAAHVMEKSHQLTLNPFQGYPEAQRNLLDPHVRDAVRTFATLDGAYVVREDGVVLAAGRYLNVDAGLTVKMPLGLGARHTAAAGMSLQTGAACIVVSQTTGTVRMYRKGVVVLELTPQRRRG